jgi:ribonuclease HI
MLTIYTDGACSNNPGPGGAGAVLLSNIQEPTATLSNYLGDDCTNNVAEYTAIIQALEIWGQASQEVTIYTDSKLIVEQIYGRWKVKAPHLQSLHVRLADLLSNASSWSLIWVKGHVGNPFNEMADRLATDAIKHRQQRVEAWACQ